MTKKPAEQTSNQPGGSGDEVDLLDDHNDGGTGESDDDSEDGDDDGDGDGGQQSIEQQIQAGIRAALPTITQTFQSEMDRRINSAINKVTRKNGTKKQQNDDDSDEQQQQTEVQPVADVRGARIAFREYLPMELKTFSSEEQALATEFGQSRIRALALQGFDDEDDAGRQAAQETAEFIKKARALYSKRTKAVLKRQGVLVETPGQSGGQTPGGGTKPPADLASAVEAARKKDMELFPHRYANQQQ